MLKSGAHKAAVAPIIRAASQIIGCVVSSFGGGMGHASAPCWNEKNGRLGTTSQIVTVIKPSRTPWAHPHPEGNN
jgi:hypothetical protein